MNEFEEVFFNEIKLNYPRNADKIISAYRFADSAHNGCLRKSGEPYIIHPVAVAQILMNNNMDYSTIIAGLLHDVVEDTTYSLDDIKKYFGETVAKLVDGVTKIDKITLKKENLTEADNIKRLIVAMGDDIRVIFIKLADRLHNMKTIEYLSPQRQFDIATETNELFIPIAERLGIRHLRSELQELTFKCLHPDDYSHIKFDFDKNFENKKAYIYEIEDKLNDILRENNIKGSVYSWPERYYSIYKKLQTSGMEKAYGIIMFKVIVPTITDCYKMLGFLHSKFEHLPGQIKDFISSPKPNGYKSLHTVLITKDGNITFKVMLRTAEMDNVCEYGISSFWNGKDTDIDFSEKFEKFSGLKDIILTEQNESTSSNTFIDSIKVDLSSKEIWVFTPSYRPVCLKSGKPTAIDFAYALSGGIGNNAIGAVINGKKSSLATELHSGDVIEILISKTEKSPSRNWLSIAKTQEARKKIREYFMLHTTDEFINEGKDIILSELNSIEVSLDDFLDTYSELEKEFNFFGIDDMFASLGYGSVTLNQIMKQTYLRLKNKSIIENSSVKVEGLNNCININFPKCCSAIPGDEIIGVMSKNGISIHSSSCQNLKKLKGDRYRALWKENIEQLFNVNLKIIAKNKVGFASKLLKIIADDDINITKLEAKESNTSECEFKVSILIKNTAELEKVIEKIKSIEEIKCVLRVF